MYAYVFYTYMYICVFYIYIFIYISLYVIYNRISAQSDRFHVYLICHFIPSAQHLDG